MLDTNEQKEKTTNYHSKHLRVYLKWENSLESNNYTTKSKNTILKTSLLERNSQLYPLNKVNSKD